MRVSSFLGVLIAGVSVVGCATRELCVQPVGDRDLTPAVAAVGEQRVGDVVSWGGQVVEVRHLKQRTELEILGYPLDDCGRPLEPAHTPVRMQGRFLIRHAGYLEPENYRAGSRITATGRIGEIVDQRIGAARSRLPVLVESVVRRWPERPWPERCCPERHWPETFWREPWRSDDACIRFGHPAIGIGGDSSALGIGIGIRIGI